MEDEPNNLIIYFHLFQNYISNTFYAELKPTFR